MEREIANQLLLRTSYVGTKGNFLQVSRPLNLIRPGLFTPPNTAAEEAALQANGTLRNLNAGLSAAPTGTTNRLDPRFGSVTMLDSSANSNYHSLQVQAIGRVSRDLRVSAAYTWAKSIDNASDALGVLLDDEAVPQNPFNSRNDRAVSAFDVRHRFSLSHTYDLPWFKQGNRFLQETLGSWQFSGIYVVQSGLPITFRSGARAGLTDALLIRDSCRLSATRPGWKL